MGKRPRKDGHEQDVFSAWRHYLVFNRSVVADTKRAARRRERRQQRQRRDDE